MTIFSKTVKAAILGSALLLGAIEANAAAATAKPLRVGPVQNYGMLGTSGNKVISQSTKKEVMLRGMSLFWSDATGLQYYNKEVLKWAVENLKIDVIRYAMGVQYYDSQGGTDGEMDKNYSYAGSPDLQESTIDRMVEAAIENDIYIIIDWHSHRAISEQSKASAFFKKMAGLYKDVPNIIWEVYNEPVNDGMSAIASYANNVISGIRGAGANHLALVGTPHWSQMGECGGVNQSNVGYVFHFYAATHSKGSYSGNIDRCRSQGNAVFITEWGTTDANGSGSTNTSAASEWEKYMEENKISNCNWSLRNAQSTIGEKTNEASAMFSGDQFLVTQAALSGAGYTTSGSHVKEYLTKHASKWADSLVAGKNTGSCAFASASVKETAGTVTAFKSGCTYTSSDESVVTSAGQILKAGFAIMTGNDGSKSVVSVTEEPKQVLTGFQDFNCFISGSCTKSKTIKDLDNDGKLEVLATTTGTTEQGAKVTIKSLNPSVVDIKQATCSNSKGCFGKTLNSKVTMFVFSGTIGEAKIVATAPAVSGYTAMNDTITVMFTKAGDKLTGNFKSMTVAKGSVTAEVFPTETYYGKAPITYTFDGEETSPYIANNGGYLTAGNDDAIVHVTATAPETADRAATNTTITIIVGDSTVAANKGNVAIPTIAKKLDGAIKAQFRNDGIMLSASRSGNATVEVFSAQGQCIRSQEASLNAGANWMPMVGLHSGNYVVRVTQGSVSQMYNWIKK